MELNTTSPTARVIASAGLITLGACSIYFNSAFGWSQGTNDASRTVYAAMSIGFDIAKILCLPMIIWHLRKRAWTNAIAAGLIWSISVLWGMTAAVGFATVEQAHIAGEHAEKVAKKQAYDEKVAKLERDLETAKGAINEKGGSIFKNTGSCLNATKQESKDFCQAYFLKYGELEKLKAAPVQAAYQDPQPFLTLLAEMTGSTKKAVGFAMAIVMAVVLETVTALATLAFSKTVAKPGTSARAQRKAEQRRRDDERREADRRRRAARDGKVVEIRRAK